MSSCDVPHVLKDSIDLLVKDKFKSCNTNLITMV